MLRELIAYIKCPEEGRPYDYKPKSVLSSFGLYLVAYMLFTLLVGILVYLLGEAFPSLMRSKIVGHSNSPVWIVAVLGPLLEEGSFRLSLNRNKITLAVSLVLTSFLLISSFCFNRKIYTLDHLLIRICIALAVGTGLFLLLGKCMLKCRFKPYFWFWALFFGCIHLMNVNYAGMLPLDYVSLVLYSMTHIVMGLVLGYIRMKNGFIVSTSLHILNNLIYI